MSRFYITGVSGTGKSSIAEKLKEKGIPAIDLDKVEDLCQWVNKKTKERARWYPGVGNEFFRSHKYVCDREKLVNLMDEHKDKVVVVGLCDNQSDILDLFDKIFLFRCDESIFIKRIIGRTDNDFGKHESEQKMITGWYRDFEKEMLEKGAIPIDTSGSITEVTNKVLEIISN